MKGQKILAVAIIGALLAMLPLGSIGTVGCGTGKETPTLVTPTPIAITSATQQMESSKGSIAAFARIGLGQRAVIKMANTERLKLALIWEERHLL